MRAIAPASLSTTVGCLQFCSVRANGRAPAIPPIAVRLIDTGDVGKYPSMDIAQVDGSTETHIAITCHQWQAQTSWITL
jgi:hypothetical protein